MKDWERYENQIYGKFEGDYPNSRFEKNVKIKGRFSKVIRQIDVLVKGDVAFREVIGVIDCKCFSKKINVKIVEAFIGLLDDVKADFGAIITTKGFSKAAVNRAESRGVSLKIIQLDYIAEYNVRWLFGSVHVTGNLEYKCDKCRKKFVAGPEELIFEIQDVYQDRGMGPETWHSAVIQHDCSRCHNEINIVYDVWEYPMGAINLEEITPDGATTLESPYLECKV